MSALKSIFSAKPKGKTLIIHIGDHKTGSTTLQNAFATHKVFLEGAKVLYPTDLNHNYLLGVFQADARKQKSGFVSKSGSPDLKLLRAQIEASDAEYILLSGEQFEHIDIDEFKAVTDRWFADVVDKIRIVAYARPHAQRFASNFTELVKIGALDGDLNEYFERISQTGRYNFTERFSKWRAVYGENFILRPMIKSELHNASVIDDFVHTAFDGIPFHLGEFDMDNQSIGLDELMFLKFIQARFDQSQKFVRHTMAREIVRHLGSFDAENKSKKMFIHKSIAEKLKDQYWKDARALDEMFFQRRTLFQDALQNACETAPLHPVSLVPEEHFSPEELRYLTVLREILWNALQTKKNWADIFHRSRIKHLHQAAKSNDV